MIDDTPVSEFASLLSSRLLENIPLIKTPEEARWRIITETVDAMYKVFTGKVLNAFNKAAAEMYDIDLGIMIESIDGLPKTHLGHDDVLKYLRISRAKAGFVGQFYGKGTDGHAAALLAMMELQENLKKVLEYIEPINKKLNPVAIATAKTSPDTSNNASGNVH